MENIHKLYRRNNKGVVCFWQIETKNDKLIITHGILGATPIVDAINTTNIVIEREHRIAVKQRQGYKYLNEVKDSNSLPVEGGISAFLNSYLPYDRTTADGTLLPMLAKAFDNKDNKLFKKVNSYIGQFKVNGLRCMIKAVTRQDGMFSTERLVFQSREGTYWNSLDALEGHLWKEIPEDLLNKMLYEDYVLDGEIFIQGHSINDINHFVKTKDSIKNNDLQFWCYDIICGGMTQLDRIDELSTYKECILDLNVKTMDRNATDRHFYILPNVNVYNDEDCLYYRDMFIDNGFEGLILRNPHNEYQFGKRNLSMIKFKRFDDGVFKIIAINPEGIKRPDIPLITCKNDINENEFNVHIGGSLNYQRSILLNKDKYINKLLYIEFGERSGDKQVPFHVKLVKFATGFDNV